MAESLASETESVRRRFAARGADQPQSELPFCIDLGNGRRLDAMRQLRGTLAGLGAIVSSFAAIVTWFFTTGVVLTVMLVVTGITLALWLLHRVRLARAGAAWRREARPFPAALVMAHDSVFEPGPSIVPGVLLVDFGPSPDAERLQRAAEAAFATTEGEPPPHHRELADWLRADMQRGHFDRIRVPKDLAGNDTCWLVSLRLDRASMPNGHVDRRLWFVLARPDRNESAELLPHVYWVGE